MYVFFSLSLRWYVGVVVSYIEYVNWPFFLVMTFFFVLCLFCSFCLFGLIENDQVKISKATSCYEEASN